MSHTSASPGGARSSRARPDGSPTRATRCPHCRHFREPYDEVARTFNEGHGGEGEAAKVLIARVDCVANRELCSGLLVKGYPTTWWGSLESTVAVLGAIAEGKTESWPGYPSVVAPPGLSKVAGRTSEALLSHIADRVPAYKKSESAAKGAAAATPGKHTGAVASGTSPTRPSLSDMEKAAVLSVAHAFELRSNLATAGARLALLGWLYTLWQLHPSERCRVGALRMHRELAAQDAASASYGAALDRLAGWHVCRDEIEADDSQNSWEACRPSVVGYRGYTCALWTLLHAMSVRTTFGEGGLSGRGFLDAVEAYIGHFFSCESCREHFLAETAKEDFKRVETEDEAVLWLWEVHNRVNERLAAVEKGGSGDPQFPKVQFPTPEECARAGVGRCKDRADAWLRRGVVAFLRGYYRVDDDGASAGGAVLNPRARRALSVSQETMVVVASGVLVALVLVKRRERALASSLYKRSNGHNV